MKKNMKFIDLFAGIGGFHQAMEDLGHTCVCASEINSQCVEVYKKNFPNTPVVGDINEHYDKLPEFDILCGGFPCQPFSKAGKQEGFKDEKRGNLFYVIMNILKLHPECKFVILENVKNLADNTQNWNLIQEELKKQNFYVTDMPIILSPHQFGIPQIRERVYILGIRKDIRDVKKLPNGSIHMEDLKKIYFKKELCRGNSAKKILTKNVDESYAITDKEQKVLNMWIEFKKGTKYETLGVPVWVEYFGYNKTDEEFELFKDHKNQTVNEMPKWKQRFVRKNRDFYIKHKAFLDLWIKKHNVLSLPLLYKKLEWNCGNVRNIKNTIIQFRQSGIRIKKMNYFPALVAINNTPIIFDEEMKKFRRITPREAANLQSFKEEFDLSVNSGIYKQLGNSVNVEIIKRLAIKLFAFEKKGGDPNGETKY